jgi:endothelin-converting enzyme/putative endopeptidase
VTRHLIAFIFVALTTTLATAQSRAGIDLGAIDRRIDACTDFYQFACGSWIAQNPVPPDRQRWGRFNELQERNFAILRRILETPNTDGDRKKAGDYYAACVNEAAIEAKGLGALQPELARIEKLRTARELPALVAHLHSIGVGALFRFGSDTDLRDATKTTADVDQGGLALPDRDYYLKTDARSETLRGKYREHVQRMLMLAGAPTEQAARGAQAVMAIETSLAKASLDVVTRRDPNAGDHPMSVAELQALTPAFEWKRYFEATDAPSFERVNVDVPDFVKGLSAALGSTPIDDVKVYLRWHLLRASAAMLPKAFADADFDFYNRTLGGQQQQLPRWRRCVAQTDQRLGEALGKAFVEEAFGPQAKADTLKMVQGIKAAMARDIQAADWMTDETKKAAQLKLNAVVDRIGYPEKWRDYSKLPVARDDALGNLRRAVAFERNRRLTKIGKPVDRSEWSMTPPTVNAYYSADKNNINFPAGILQPPFYEAGRDAAVNYGGAGAVVGHELTHGFDDQGRKFDGQGNLRDWWTASDAKAYEQRSSCIADQYSTYAIDAETHVNGRLTLGENTADNGGVRLALMAYLAGPGAAPQPVLDGFTAEQRFFMGYAQLWCENSRPEAERLKALTNPHSADIYRVNGVISNMPEFQKAFSCKADAPMVRENACRVW